MAPGSFSFSCAGSVSRNEVYQLRTLTSSAEQLNKRTRMQSPPDNLESLRRDIAERLRPTCAHMPDDEFEKMVARIALIEWKHVNDATPTSQMLSR